jgi:hypothetical protein
MASNTEEELGLEQPELKADASRDVPFSGWTATVDALAERRERSEVAALAAALNPARASPRRIADEMRSRGRFLRSKRGALFTKKLELEILGELDAIEALARAVDAGRQRGTLTEKQEAAELRTLDPLVFAVRVRFEALQRAQDLPFCRQARHAEPGARKRELDEIEEFLARKNRREAA